VSGFLWEGWGGWLVVVVLGRGLDGVPVVGLVRFSGFERNFLERSNAAGLFPAYFLYNPALMVSCLFLLKSLL